MRKFASLVPLLLAVFMAVYGYFDNSVFAYITAHSSVAFWLGAAFVVSEALASTELIKSNSVAEAVFDLLGVVLGKMLRKPIALPCLMLFALLSAGMVYGQDATPAPELSKNIYAGGVSFNSGASPSVAGTGLYARLVSSSAGTYAFSVFDAVPNTLRPFTVNSNVSVGVAQKLFTIGKIPIYVPTAAGVSWTGANTGWNWSTGGMAVFKVKGNYLIMPTVRLTKSSVSNGSGYQPIIGVLFGWGQ